MASAGRRWWRLCRTDSIGGTERAMPAWARSVHGLQHGLGQTTEGDVARTLGLLTAG